MLTLQNESIAATNWDSCVWTAEAVQKTFLRDHLYPAMVKAGLSDRDGHLYIWDHNKERVLECGHGPSLTTTTTRHGSRVLPSTGTPATTSRRSN